MTRHERIEEAKQQAQDPITIREEAGRYQRAKVILDALRRNQRLLTPQEYKTIRGQALAGDVEGANKGLKRLIGERGGI